MYVYTLSRAHESNGRTHILHTVVMPLLYHVLYEPHLRFAAGYEYIYIIYEYIYIRFLESITNVINILLYSIRHLRPFRSTRLQYARISFNLYSIRSVRYERLNVLNYVQRDQTVERVYCNIMLRMRMPPVIRIGFDF